MPRLYYADRLRPKTRSLVQESVSPAFQRFFNGPDLWASEALWKAYCRWRHACAAEDYARFKQYYCGRRDQARGEVDAWESPFKNAKKGEPYEISFKLPDCCYRYQFIGLDKAGLKLFANPQEPGSLLIKGQPSQPGEFEISLLYIWPDWVKGLPVLKRDFCLLVNPDPRDLWEDIPSDQSGEYARPDCESASLSNPPVKMLAASRRGRSHAHAGKPRDDAFGLACENGWNILAVADGAGSAEFSRKGAELACAIALANAGQAAASAEELEAVFEGLEPGVEPALWLGQAKKLAYKILPNAAFEANKAIRQEAETNGREARAYATTLLLCLAKKFPGGWAILSFQIGDGAMAMFSDANATLLAEPDEGEYSGQTRFITMNEIFSDPHELMRRLRIDFVGSLDGLLLMTDGVSDARFATLEGLSDQTLWLALWQEMKEIAQNPGSETSLLEWLNFWSKGNHDDRTLAMLTVEQANVG